MEIERTRPDSQFLSRSSRKKGRLLKMEIESWLTTTAAFPDHPVRKGGS